MNKDLIYVACRKIGARPGPYRDDEVRLVSRYACRDGESLTDMLARLGAAYECICEEVEADEDATNLARHQAYVDLEILAESYCEGLTPPEFDIKDALQRALEAIRKTPRVWVETWRKKS